MTAPVVAPPRAPVGETFGAQLARLREAAGLTMEELAQRVGTHRSKVSRWEAGHEAPAHLDLYERIACALDAPLVLCTGRSIVTIAPVPR